MKSKIDTLESMGDWEIIDQDDSMNAIDLPWTFKCKRSSDGLINNIKG